MLAPRAMGQKRFYDAVRDLIRDVNEPPEQPARTRRRLSIASLLASPQICAACWDQIPDDTHALSCNCCLGAYCPSCLAEYARTALTDRQLLPLRCADQKCRAPVPLSGLNGLLTTEQIARLSRFQCEMLRQPGDSAEPAEEASTRLAPEKDDGNEEALRSLMGAMGWRRCPDCGMGIERTQGCPHMVCVCGGEFCYSCGGRWQGRGLGCSQRCGLPPHHDTIRGLFPARFDELRDEVWQRITALLHRLREHLERDRRAGWMEPLETWQLDMPRVAATRNNDAADLHVPRMAARSSTRSTSRNDVRPVKMRLRSLVHPENRL